MVDDALPLPTRRFLSRPQAADYVGVSPRVFDIEVQQGRWPKPYRRGSKEGALTWDRFVLDRWADRLGDLLPAGRAEEVDRAAEEEALRRAAQTDNGRQGRPQKEPERLAKAG